MLYKTQIIKLRKYLESRKDYLLDAIVKHDKNRDKYSIFKEALKYLREIGLGNNENYTEKEIKKAVIRTKIKNWKAKPLHGQFYKEVIESINQYT